jgi:hypothetical protein
VNRPASHVLAAALALLALAPEPARAQAPAAADSSLHRFLDTLADSTDRYFGLVATPTDTAGLDSALAAGLARPWSGPRSRARLALAPVYAFNRVDGTLWGGSASFGDRSALRRMAGDLGYAAGSDTWLGGAELSAGLRRRGTTWRARVSGGRRTETLNRDADSPGMALVRTARALIWGSDRHHYLRRDGFSVGVSGTGSGWRAGLEYRDRLESPLPVTTRWNLTRRALASPDNVAATPGRARELGFEGDLRVPGLPFHLQLTQHTADRALGSEFDYRRLRLALGGELVAGRRVSLVPQLAYGRLAGDPLPQASFFLGGTRSLRGLPRESLGGTGLAVARLDLIGADDLLALARIPHPAMLYLQGGLFAATGAVWGADPFGGPGSAPGAWPERSAWRSEAGVSLLYRPGIPDPDAYLRLNLAWPVGLHDDRPRWSMSYSRALDLLNPF